MGGERLEEVSAGVARPWDEVLKVLVRYWKMSCNLDNLSCFSWSDPFAVAVGLIGDRGESARLKVAAMGEVGCGLDSNSTNKV